MNKIKGHIIFGLWLNNLVHGNKKCYNYFINKGVEGMTARFRESRIFLLFIAALFFMSLSSAARASDELGTPEWTVTDGSGKRKDLKMYAGHLNVNSKVSNSQPDLAGSDFDIILDRLEGLQIQFMGVTDLSQNLSVRAFCLFRGAALARAKQSKVGLSGFKWVGDAGISKTSLAAVSVVGCDSYVYNSPSGQTVSVGEKYKTQDFLGTTFKDSSGNLLYKSEYDYVNIIKNGTYKFASSTYYNSLKSALDQYILDWTEEGIDFNNILGGEVLEELRKDMEKRFDEQNNSLNIRTPKLNYDDVGTWIQLKGSANNYLSAMICFPQGSDTGSEWGEEFFKQKYSDTSNDYVTMVEVKSTDNILDTSMYRKALENGWKVSPATGLNNQDAIATDADQFFTGLWSEKITTQTGGWLTMLNVLEALRSRRTFVTNYAQGALTLKAEGKTNNIVAIMGETITRDEPAIISIGVGIDKSNTQLSTAKPLLVVVFKNNDVKYYPFVSYFNDLSGHGPRDPHVDRYFTRHVDSFSNIRCFYAIMDVYRVQKEIQGKSQFDDTWSYYKFWKYLNLGKLNSERYQMVSAPIFVDIK